MPITNEALRRGTHHGARKWLAVAAVAAVAACGACTNGTQTAIKDVGVLPVSVPVTVQTANGPVVFDSEVADTPAARQRGMMFREDMGDRAGMLFVFPMEKHQSFWMKNTLIPLDLIFIRADRTILGVVENAEPETLTGRSVPGISQFVLEVKGGTSADLGIEEGGTTTFMVPIPER